MLKHSDLIALCRLVEIETRDHQYSSIVEPSTGFKGDVVATGFLNDLLIRGGSCFNSKDTIQSVIDQINNSTRVHADLRVRPYDTAAGALSHSYGIEFDNSVTLWLTRYLDAPATVVDLSTQPQTVTVEEASDPKATVVTPVALRAALEDTTNETEPTDVEDVTWFDKLGELNGDQKAWLLVQFNAAFTRIGRKDLFAELVEAIDSK